MTAQSEIRTRYPLIIAACTGVIFSSIVLPYYTIGALVGPVTEELGWTRAEFQAAILFSSGLGALTAPIVGWLCDRYGARRIALPGMLGLCLGFVVASQMQGELWVLYFAYGAMAVLGATTIPVTWTRAITLSFSSRRGLALGLTLSGTGICAIVMPQYTTWLVANWGWRAAYLGIGLLPILVAAPVVFALFRPEEGARSAGDLAPEPTTELGLGLSLAEAARTYRFWVLLLSILVVYMAVSGIAPNLYAAVTDAGMSGQQAANVQSAFGLAIILGRLAVGYLVDRFWAPGVAALSMLLPVVGCSLLIDPGSYLLALSAAWLVGIAAGAELDLMSFLAARYFGLRHYAQIYSVLYMALAICSGSAPFLFASVFDATGSYATGFGIAAILFAIGAGVILLMGRYPEHAAASLGQG